MRAAGMAGFNLADCEQICDADGGLVAAVLDDFADGSVMAWVPDGDAVDGWALHGIYTDRQVALAWLRVVES